MKNEKNLLALPFKELSIDIPEPKQQIKTTSNGNYTKTYYYYGYTAEIPEKNVLGITVWTRKVGQEKPSPEYRIFIGDYDYISQRLKDGEWRRSTAKPYKIYQIINSWHWNNKIFIADEENRAIAVKFLKCYKNDEPDVFKRVAHYVDGIGQQRLKEKRRRIRESIDDVMLQIRPLPKDFEKWLDDIVYKENRYILYQYSRKKETDGYCTHCGRRVKVSGAKHQKQGICPNCKSKITYLASGKTNNFDVSKQAVYIQTGKDNEVIFRTFDIRRHFRNNHDGTMRVVKKTTETIREFYFSNKSFAYEYREYEHGYNWYRASEYNYNRNGYIYYKNIKKIFRQAEHTHPHLGYIPYSELLKNISNITGRAFYIACIQQPQIEYLAKLRLYKLAQELIDGRLRSYYDSEENIMKLLDINKGDIKYIQQYNMGAAEIRIYKMCKMRDVSMLPTAMEIYKQYGETYTSKLLKMTRYMSIESAIEYAAQQYTIYRKDSYSGWIWSDNKIRQDVLSDWLDYIDNCDALGWNIRDTKVLKPKDLKERHDIALGLVKLNKLGGAERITKRYYENIFDFGYDNKEFSVTMPKDILDLKYEGDMMHHCVYTNYAEKVASGKSIILFIRNNMEFYKPLATAEINPNTYEVIQIRGERNNPVSKEVSAFFNEYKRNVLNKLKSGRRAA